jgi:hypothetical protein
MALVPPFLWPGPSLKVGAGTGGLSCWPGVRGDGGRCARTVWAGARIRGEQQRPDHLDPVPAPCSSPVRSAHGPRRRRGGPDVGVRAGHGALERGTLVALGKHAGEAPARQD